jgi:hypothetical protein
MLPTLKPSFHLFLFVFDILCQIFILIIGTTQPTTQHKAKQLGWCGIIIAKKPTTPPHHHRVSLHLRQF